MCEWIWCLIKICGQKNGYISPTITDPPPNHTCWTILQALYDFPRRFQICDVLRVNMFSFVKNTGHRWICQFCKSMANVTWAPWSQGAKKGPVRARQYSCLDFFMFYCEFDPLLYFWISGFGAYLIPVPGENFQVVCVPVLFSLHYSKLVFLLCNKLVFWCLC